MVRYSRTEGYQPFGAEDAARIMECGKFEWEVRSYADSNFAILPAAGGIVQLITVYDRDTTQAAPKVSLTDFIYAERAYNDRYGD